MGFKGGVRAGGGFWNEVDGVIEGFVFSDKAPGSTESGEWLYLVVTFRVDGADKSSTQHLFMGGVDRYDISKDRKTATSIGADGEPRELTIIGGKTPVGRFLFTLAEKGEELGIDAILPDLEGGDPLNLEGIEGTRVRLVQEKDERGTKKSGKRMGKDGQSYDRTNSIVETVYSLPGETAATKGAAKSASRTNGSGKAAAVVTTAIRDKADGVVLGLIASATDKKNKDGETPTSKLKMAALRSLSKDADKDAVIKMLGDGAYLTGAAERGIFIFDHEGETVASA